MMMRPEKIDLFNVWREFIGLPPSFQRMRVSLYGDAAEAGTANGCCTARSTGKNCHTNARIAGYVVMLHGTCRSAFVAKTPKNRGFH
jgi:hypothetical protein